MKYSLRELYPNIDGNTVIEQTVPEPDERQNYQVDTSSDTTATGIYKSGKGLIFSSILLFLILVILLHFIGE